MRDSLRTILIHSHSIVPGGLLVTSYTTRFTPLTLVDDASYEALGQALRECSRVPVAAVMKSSVLVTARKAHDLFSYVRTSPITPTVRTGRSTANA